MGHPSLSQKQPESCYRVLQSLVYHRNNQSLAIGIKSQEIVSDILTQTTEYNLRQRTRDFRIPSVNTVYHSFESTSYIDSKILEIISIKINESNSPNSFKKEIRNQVPKSFPCRLRKKYMWCWFSNIMSSCIFYIQSICFVILLLDFNNFYVFALMFLFCNQLVKVVR